ncbi:hypothetical protein HMPREF9073_02637 [Capnocytophaga sp. oral taxon 326 str. F0382]|nr:hypothetical protein HMPREF9073_02637 [Capnocytophaga sp. oral taxon 326 str. F0382]
MLCRKASDSWVCAANALTNRTFHGFFYSNPPLRVFPSFSKILQDSQSFSKILKVFPSFSEILPLITKSLF